RRARRCGGHRGHRRRSTARPAHDRGRARAAAVEPRPRGGAADARRRGDIHRYGARARRARDRHGRTAARARSDRGGGREGRMMMTTTKPRRRLRIPMFVKFLVGCLALAALLIVGGTYVVKNETQLRNRGNYLQKSARRLAGYVERVGQG